MLIPDLHPWPETYRDAVRQQELLAPGVLLQDRLPATVRHIAGVDVSYEKHGDRFFAGVVVLSYPDLQIVEQQTAVATVHFPYIPGLLSFRELPVLLDALRRVKQVPDLVLVDGQGLAHPRRLGIACHLGLWLGLPTVGCAKSRLCGEHAGPGPAKGDRADLVLDGEQVGQVVRTRDNIRPLYVSPGHLVTVATASRWALNCCTRYRMPEPTRLAHLLTNRERMSGRDGC